MQIFAVLLFFLFLFPQPVFAQSSPTFGVIAPCPSCTSPSEAPVSASVVPSAGVPVPSPAIDPCSTDSSYADNARHGRHKKHSGAINKVMEAILKFFFELIVKLLELLGGGKISQPSSGEPVPSAAQEAPIISSFVGYPNQPQTTPQTNPCPSGSSGQEQPLPTASQPSSVMSQPSTVAPSTGAPSGTQKLGCGGVAAPPGATLTTTDAPAALNISQGGTEGNPKVYDGQCHTVGTISIRANYVVVQNFKIVATGEDGISSRGNFVTIQNNDIKNVHAGSGDGDLNAMNFFGNNVSIKYNTAINFVGGSAGGSHTDAIQTWNQRAGEASSNVVIMGNHFEGPPSEGTDQHIHQGVICEGALSTDGGGGGTGASQNWLVADNFFTADLKFDDCDNIYITRNTFAGNDKRAVVTTPLSTGVKYFSDNKVTGQLSVGIGLPVTEGAGPTTLPVSTAP